EDHASVRVAPPPTDQASVPVAANSGGAATAGILDLIGTAVLSNGTLTNHGTIDVTNAANALHDETVTTDGTITVEASAVLTLDQGGSLDNSGTINVKGTATIDGSTAGGVVTVTNTNLVEVFGGGQPPPKSDRTLHNSAGPNDGPFQVDDDGKLTVAHTTIDQGSVTVAANSGGSATAGILDLISTPFPYTTPFRTHGTIDVTNAAN